MCSAHKMEVSCVLNNSPHFPSKTKELQFALFFAWDINTGRIPSSFLKVLQQRFIIWKNMQCTVILEVLPVEHLSYVDMGLVGRHIPWVMCCSCCFFYFWVVTSWHGTLFCEWSKHMPCCSATSLIKTTTKLVAFVKRISCSLFSTGCCCFNFSCLILRD